MSDLGWFRAEIESMPIRKIPEETTEKTKDCLLGWPQDTTRLWLSLSSLSNLMTSSFMPSISSSRSSFRWTCDDTYDRKEHSITTRRGVLTAVSMTRHTGTCDRLSVTRHSRRSSKKSSFVWCVLTAVTRQVSVEQHRSRFEHDDVRHENDELPRRKSVSVNWKSFQRNQKSSV